jgi:tRNA-(ms[2]io[6]A)-hydroxylase
MLGLKLVTDPRWVNIVESNIEEILTDHAWCEQKKPLECHKFDHAKFGKRRTSNRLMIIAREELEHLQMVHDLIKSKGLSLDGTQRSLCK